MVKVVEFAFGLVLSLLVPAAMALAELLAEVVT
jgi:hypothetical protein